MLILVNFLSKIQRVKYIMHNDKPIDNHKQSLQLFLVSLSEYIGFAAISYLATVYKLSLQIMQHVIPTLHVSLLHLLSHIR